MADQEQRAEESKREAEDKFHQEREAEESERAEAAREVDEPVAHDED
jgi:hypothetical protein